MPHTQGPLDGSLYATVTKRRDSNTEPTTNIQHLQQQQRLHQLQQQHLQQQHLQQQQQQQQNLLNQHQFTPEQTPHRTPAHNIGHHYPGQQQHSLSTPHTPQHSTLQHHSHHTPHPSNQHLSQHQYHLSQHHHHHHIHHQSTLPLQHSQASLQQHQQYLNSAHSNSQTPSHTPAHPSLSTPSPQSAYMNGRYAASVDSGFASSLAPLSPPTSDCPVSSVSPASQATAVTVCQPSSTDFHIANQSQEHSHQQPQQVLRRFSDPNQLNMAPLQSSRGISSRADARQLDELLAGMLLDIENIPDLRPGQTPAPDIDSIRCPDLSWNSSRGRSSSTRSGGQPLSPVNGYGGSHHGGMSNHDSMLDTSLSLSAADDAPYHTRMDSRPFSYGAVTSSPVLQRRRSPSPNSSPNRRPSREPMISRSGLESPRLVRRMSGNVGAVTSNNTTNNHQNTANSHHSTTNNQHHTTNSYHSTNHHSEQHSSGMVNSTIASVIGNSRRSPSPSPEPGSRGSTLRRERSQTLTNRIMAGDPSPPATLTRSHVSRSASRLDDPDTIFSPDALR